MNAIKGIATASALIALSSTSALASVIGPANPGGSEVILSLVNISTNDSMSIDLGKTMGQLVVGDSFSLSAEAQGFIASAGGLSGIQYGLQAGDTSNFSTNTFLTSSTGDLGAKAVANATKGTWSNSIIQLSGNLNAGDESGTEVNNTYGPFDDGVGSPNFMTGGHFNWQTGDADLNTLANGTEQTALFQYSLTGFVGTSFAQQVLAPVELSGDKLSIVPIPAAVWLFGSALMGLFGAGRRTQIAAAVAGFRNRLSVRTVDLMA